MVDKRRSADYKQLSGHILASLYRKFKATCAERDTDQSSALEQAVVMWIDQESAKTQDDTKEELAQFIKSLVAGETPNDGECAIIAHELDLRTEEVIALRDRTTQKTKNGNGHSG